jgi:hypothetical protein
MQIKLFSTKKTKKNNKDIENAKTLGLAAAGIASGIGGATMLDKANNEGALTGRVHLYHNAKSDAVKSILEQGLDGKKTLDPNSYTNNCLNGAATKDGRALVYTSKSKWGADNIGRCRYLNGDDYNKGKTLKIKMGYDDYLKRRVKDNPELKGKNTKAAYKKYYRDYIKACGYEPNIAHDVQSNYLYNQLNAKDDGKCRIFKDKVDRKWIKNSKHYQKNSLKEWASYVKKHPGHFAKGAAKAAAGTALLGGSAYALTKAYKRADADNKKKK